MSKKLVRKINKMLRGDRRKMVMPPNAAEFIDMFEKTYAIVNKAEPDTFPGLKKYITTGLQINVTGMPSYATYWDGEHWQVKRSDEQCQNTDNST